MIKPTVSVVIPCYNAAPFLRETLESALNQTHPPLEVIVVDDGSTDETYRIAQEYGQRIVLHRLSENRGKSVALNWAIKRAHGEFIMILDADDLLVTTALETLVVYLRSRNNIGIAFGHATLFDSNGTIAEKHPITEEVKELPFEPDGDWRQFDRQSFFNATLARSYCPMSSTLFRKRCLDLVGPHHEKVRSGQDWEMLVRLANRFQFAFTDRVLSHMRRHDRNLSSSKLHRYSRFEGESIALSSILETIELSKDAGRDLEHRLLKTRLSWGRALLGDAQPCEARRVFSQIKRNGNARVPVTWTALSYLPAIVLRGIRTAKRCVSSLLQ